MDEAQQEEAQPRCAKCGAGLGIGRFCLNCGHPVDVPVAARDRWDHSLVSAPLPDQQSDARAVFPTVSGLPFPPWILFAGVAVTVAVLMVLASLL